MKTVATNVADISVDTINIVEEPVVKKKKVNWKKMKELKIDKEAQSWMGVVEYPESPDKKPKKQPKELSLQPQNRLSEVLNSKERSPKNKASLN